MRMVSGGGMRAGFTSAETSPPGRARPSSTGIAAKDTISSRRASRPVVSRSTTQKRARRHGVPGAGSSARAYSSAAGVLGFTLTRR